MNCYCFPFSIVSFTHSFTFAPPRFVFVVVVVVILGHHFVLSSFDSNFHIPSVFFSPFSIGKMFSGSSFVFAVFIARRKERAEEGEQEQAK